MSRARSPKAKDERRQLLLEAALAEFFERGFAAARMDDIARRAGVSKGSLYLYFDSKEALFNGLVETLALPNIALIEQSVQQAPSAIFALRTLLTLLPKLLRQSNLPLLAKIIIGDSQSFPEIVQQYRTKVIERGLGAMTALLVRGNETGEWEADNPELTARLIMAPAIFSAIWRVVFERCDEQAMDLDAFFQLHTQFILRALNARGE